MIESKMPPYVRFDFFVRGLSPANRINFGILLVILVFFTGLLVFNYHHSDFWQFEPIPIADTRTEDVVIQTVDQNYRQFNMLGRAHFHIISYSAPRFEPNHWAILWLALGLAIGWGSILAACSRIEGFWGYAVYFLFFSFVYSANFGLGFGWEKHQMLVTSGVILLFLGLSYAFKTRSPNWATAYQVPVFSGLFMALFGLVYTRTGFAGLFQTTTFGFPILIALLCFCVILWSKDWVNLILYWGNNRPNPAKRLSLPMLAVLFFIWLVYLGLLLLQVYGYLPTQFSKLLFLKPIHILGIAALLTVFSTQNIYSAYREIIPVQSAFTTFLLGICIVCVSFLAFMYANAEYTFKTQFDRFWIGFVFFVGLFQVLYILINFYPYIKEKINIYYTILEARFFRFDAVWLSALLFVVLLEGYSGWRIFYTLVGTNKNCAADYALITDSKAEALNHYDYAKSFMPNDIKSHFNHAALLIEQAKFYEKEDDVFKIVDDYRQSDFKGAFAPATLNLGNFLQLIGQENLARAYYQERLQIKPSPYISSNLAYLHWRNDQPDSAIVALKQGLSDNPTSAPLLTNLAMIYRKYQKPREAEQFAKLAIESEPDNSLIQENYYIILLNKIKNKPTIEEIQAHRPSLNQALLYFKAGLYPEADQLCDKVMKKEASPDLLLLKMLAQAECDSLPNAISRYKWLSDTYPEYKAIAAHSLATYYFKKNVPEMAQYYFAESQAAGYTASALNVAYMDLDLGFTQKGYEALAKFRLSYPEYANVAAREMAMVDLANGQVDQAYALWDFKDMTYYEAMRAGKYGAVLGKSDSLAVKFYQKWVDQDSSITAPYLETAQMMADLGNYPEALKLIGYGLKRNSKDQALLAKKAKIHWMADNKAEVESVLKTINTNYEPAMVLKAEIALAKGQKAEAEKICEQILKKNGLNIDAFKILAQILLEQNNWKKGYQAASQAFDLNSRNEYIWYYLGQFAVPNGLEESAINALEKAIEFCPSAERRLKYEKELKNLKQKIKTELSNND